MKPNVHARKLVVLLRILEVLAYGGSPATARAESIQDHDRAQCSDVAIACQDANELGDIPTWPSQTTQASRFVQSTLGSVRVCPEGACQEQDLSAAHGDVFVGAAS